MPETVEYSTGCVESHEQAASGLQCAKCKTFRVSDGERDLCITGNLCLIAKPKVHFDFALQRLDRNLDILVLVNSHVP